MRGLLQRLGARATGMAWTVRSDVRLPFAAERMADLQVPQAADHIPPPRLAEPPRAPAPDLASAARSAADPAARHPADPAPAHADPQRTLQATAQPVPLVLRPTPPMSARPQPLLDADAGTQAPTALRPAAMAAPDPGPTAAAELADARAPVTAQSLTAAPAAQRMPAPLLPATRGGDVPPHHTAHTAPATPFGPQRAPSAAPQETEVHIHIGRIDVTALHEAPRPKARTRERAQPMSLDAYLAQRGTAK